MGSSCPRPTDAFQWFGERFERAGRRSRHGGRRDHPRHGAGRGALPGPDRRVDHVQLLSRGPVDDRLGSPSGGHVDHLLRRRSGRRDRVLSSRGSTISSSGDGVWAHSAGNYRDSHWQGESVDADGNGWVELAPGEEIAQFDFSSSAGDDIRVSMQWNDWTAVNQDYSLHLFRIDGAGPVEVASADRLQSGQARPGADRVPRASPSPSPAATASGSSARTSPASTTWSIFSLDVPVDRPGRGGFADDPRRRGRSDRHRGDERRGFGLRAALQLGRTNQRRGRVARRWSRSSRTSPRTTGWFHASYNGLIYGTSFACPHVAGAAAVVMSAHPGWSGAQVRDFLERCAIDKGAVGKDPDFGSGRLNLGASPLSSCSFQLDPTHSISTSAPISVAINVTTDAAASGRPSAAGLGAAVDRRRDRIRPDDRSSCRQRRSVADRHGTDRGRNRDSQPTGIGCSYAVEPLSFRLNAAGGTARSRSTPLRMLDWSAVSEDGWIEVTSGMPFPGSGTAVFAVETNSSGGERVDPCWWRAVRWTWSSSPPAAAYLVAGVADTAGAAGSRWKSNLAIANRSAWTAVRGPHLSARRRRVHRTVARADGGAWSSTTWPPAVRGPDSSGVVDVQSSTPLVIVTARTFNDTSTGTFGQFLPGVETVDGMSGGQTAVLSQLRSYYDFRTNIGFVNLGGDAVVRSDPAVRQ